MAQRFDSMAEHDEMALVLWPGPEDAEQAPSAATADFLRMYPPGQSPQSGALRSDHLERDSHWHFHDMHQLFFNFEGAVQIEAAGVRHYCSQQLAIWIPAGVAHRVRLHGTPSGSVFFTQDSIANAGDRLRCVIVTPLMREMLREAVRWPLHGHQTPVREAFYAALAALCSEWIEEQETRLHLPACTDPRLRRALAFTSLRIDAQLADVCRHAGMSERSLRRRLKDETGLTWDAYRQRGRLLRAVTLLSETELCVADVASRCGFESPSAFAKAFRLSLGDTPSRFRNRSRRV
jgi:AraC-like DNA-binding protein